ncbi:MAG TPA: 6-hydroxycyclohex-1-ene-1-carbonyl-CoA dehydrogenase [Vicinamibacterales bacterium]|nr:6-hydroxycyclohex-1-ene-1-carbonyl-CoA dehydrogenase [Vicinamibacterales bacterium]
MSSASYGLFLTGPRTLELRDLPLPPLETGEARVRVAGCGLCHTDIGFYSGAVRTKHDLPLVLGHEIAGVVDDVAGGPKELIGRQVLVPAVMPCGACDVCRAGRPLACQRQLMPGNDMPGGFATHVVVPANRLVPLPDDLGDHSLASLSVIADAVTTPYQAIQRACVNTGDLVVVIGVGGIGTYGVQIARACGAAVAAVDVDGEKLARASALGAGWTFNAAETDGRAIKKTLLAESGVCTARWRILEMSGTAAGQELAWALLVPGGTLGIVGFTMDKVSIRLSNLMALDATAFGNWGCAPQHYPAVADLVLSGQVQVAPFVELHALKDGPALFAEPHRGKRPVLVP